VVLFLAADDVERVPPDVVEFSRTATDRNFVTTVAHRIVPEPPEEPFELPINGNLPEYSPFYTGWILTEFCDSGTLVVRRALLSRDPRGKSFPCGLKIHGSHVYPTALPRLGCILNPREATLDARTTELHTKLRIETVGHGICPNSVDLYSHLFGHLKV
jgi:hypothetical protein